MKLRLGMALGFGIGYYLGAKAGRERYEQLRRILQGLEPAERVHAAIELVRDRRNGLRPNPADSMVPPSPN